MHVFFFFESKTNLYVQVFFDLVMSNKYNKI